MTFAPPGFPETGHPKIKKREGTLVWSPSLPCFLDWRDLLSSRTIGLRVRVSERIRTTGGVGACRNVIWKKRVLSCPP